MSWLDSIKFTADGLIPAIAQDHATGRILMMAWMNAESLKLTAETKTAVYFSRSRNKLWHKGETSGHTQQVHSIRLDCDADVIVISVTQIGGIACHTGRESCFFQELNFDGDTPQWESVDPVIKDPHDIYGNHSHSHSDNQSHTHNQAPSSSTHNVKEEISAGDVLSALDKILVERKTASPDSSYVASLYNKGLNKILEKVGEESVETIISAKEYQQSLGKDETSSQTSIELKNDLVYEIADVWFHTLVTLAWFDISSDFVLNELSRRFGLSGIDEKANRT